MSKKKITQSGSIINECSIEMQKVTQLESYLKGMPNWDSERKERQMGSPKMQGPNWEYKILDTIVQ